MNESFTDETFDKLSLNPAILRGVNELHFDCMTPVQKEAIPALLKGKDVIVQAKTGTGKTAAFGLPILQNTDPEEKCVQALILSPTRELAVQVAGDIRSYAAFLSGIKTLAVYGGQEISRQITGLKGTQIVVGTPGRIMDHMRRHTLKLENVRTVILDEADEMLDMGFREDMETILGSIEQNHQTALFSATMPKEIMDLADTFLNDPERILISGDELTVSDIEQYYYSVKREYKTQALIRLLACCGYKKCMVFCNMKSTVDTLVSELQKEGVMAEALHGDLNQCLRDAAMKRFKENDSCVLVATDIAARGIDVSGVEAVFNYDLPLEPEYYVHRIGRTGRAGKKGISHTLVGSREFSKVRFIESFCHSQMTEKSIPGPEEIRELSELSSMREALKIAAKRECDEELSRVHEFCLKEKITPEELAAAFLFLKTGAKKEDLEICLPAKGEKKRTFREKEQASGKGKEKRKQTNRENSKWGDYSEIEKEFREEKRKKPDKSFPKSEDRKENRTRSKRVLKEAVKDVDRNGRAKTVRSTDARGWTAPKKKNRI